MYVVFRCVPALLHLQGTTLGIVPQASLIGSGSLARKKTQSVVLPIIPTVVSKEGNLDTSKRQTTTNTDQQTVDKGVLVTDRKQDQCV